MPKGRGSNKTGGGPTAARPQGSTPNMAALELMVLKSQYQDALVENRLLQQRVTEATRLIIAVILTKRDHTVNLTQAQVAKLANYTGVNVQATEDGGVTVSLVKAEAVPDEAGS